MKNEYYRLLPKEDRERLTDKLVERSSGPNAIVAEMGIPQRGYHIFILLNGAGVMTSKDDEVIQVGVRNFKHAEQTRTLLSYIANIQRNKFIPVE